MAQLKKRLNRRGNLIDPFEKFTKVFLAVQTFLYRDPEYSWDACIYPEGHKQS